MQTGVSQVWLLFELRGFLLVGLAGFAGWLELVVGFPVDGGWGGDDLPA